MMNKKYRVLLITGAILLLYILVCIGLNTLRGRYHFFTNNSVIIKGDTWTGRAYYTGSEGWKEIK